MDKLNEMRDILIDAVYNQLADLDHACTHELGEVVDMIKDIDEAVYYETVVWSMNNNKTEE